MKERKMSDAFKVRAKRQTCTGKCPGTLTADRPPTLYTCCSSAQHVSFIHTHTYAHTQLHYYAMHTVLVINIMLDSPFSCDMWQQS